MARVGSRKWMGYTANDGTVLGVKIDESNGEQLGFVDVTDTNVGDMQPLPSGFKMRYLNCVLVGGTNNETIRRKFNVGTLAAFNAAIAARKITIDGEDWGISSTRGEKSTIIFAYDTAQTDGDAT